jgi:hypothetical protein
MPAETLERIKRKTSAAKHRDNHRVARACAGESR